MELDCENRKKILYDIKLPNQLIFKNSNHIMTEKKIINIKFKESSQNLDDFDRYYSKRCIKMP